MKFNSLLLFHVPLIFLLAFSQKTNAIPHTGKITANPADTTIKKWIDDFKAFRDAVYKDDTAKLKSFFKFPVLNPANEIWYLVLSEKEGEAKSLAATITPFTEMDFNNYYKKLFPAAFVKALLKIKSAELFNKGEAESAEIKDSTATIKMYASVEKAKKILSLSLAYNTEWKEESGEVMDGGESTVIYSFRILKNGHLQFMYVQLAG